LPSDRYLDLDPRPTIDGEEIYIPQHPGGRAKELGLIDTSEAGGVCRVLNSNTGCCGCSGYNDVKYTCDTEGGSSGSPVLARSTHRVIALHHCGGQCNGNKGVPVEQFSSTAIAHIYPNGMPNFDDPVEPPNNDYPDCAHEFKIKLLSDKYASETSWSLKDSDGATLATHAVWLGGNGYLSDSTPYEHFLCVPEGTLTFDIRDSYGDGICCGYGVGSYELFYDGDKVHEGGEFDYFEEVQVPPPPPCKTFKLDLLTDNWPYETSWDVKDSNDQEVFSGNGYTEKMTTYVATACLEPGETYRFTMYDSYGDGICCGYGSGNYELTYGGVVIVSSGGIFTSQDTVDFS
jgi:hypothetical protein